jgi:hypothetical protein
MSVPKDTVLYDFFSYTFTPERLFGVDLLPVDPDEEWAQFEAWTLQARSAMNEAPSGLEVPPTPFDLLPECHVMDLDFLRDPDRRRRIWIRAEYVRAFKAIEEYNRNPSKLPTVMILTGQPGIGTFSYSHLRRNSFLTLYREEFGGIMVSSISPHIAEQDDHYGACKRSCFSVHSYRCHGCNVHCINTPIRNIV